MNQVDESREGLSPELVNALKAFVHSSNNIYNTIITFASHSEFRIDKQNKKKRSIERYNRSTGKKKKISIER